MHDPGIDAHDAIRFPEDSRELGEGVATGRVLDVSGTEWRRANTSFQQVTYDETECARASEHAGDMPWTIVGGIVDMVVVPLGDKLRGASYDRCMHGRGYVAASSTSSAN